MTHGHHARAPWTILVLSLPGLLCWGLPSAWAADEATSAPFVLATASGKTLRGTLMRIEAEGSVKLEGPEGGTVRGAEIVALRRTDRLLPAPPLTEQLVLANGDRLPGEIVDLGGQRVQLKFLGQTLNLPLSVLRVLWLQPSDGPEAEEPGRLLRRLATESRTRDTLLLRNGDSIEGILTGLDGQSVRVEAGRRMLEVERNRVAAIALNTELLLKLKPRDRYIRVVLRNGGRLSLASATWAPGQPLTGMTLFKAEVTIPIEELAALYVFQGAAVYLSDQEPRKVEYTSYGEVSWPYVPDASVDHRDLRLGRNAYDKGLGTHSETRLTYALTERYRRFEALVGLDPQTGRRGSARIKVLVDGKEQDLGGSGEVTAGEPPREVHVDLANARELTLVVEFGKGGPVQDHVNWADARLIR